MLGVVGLGLLDAGLLLLARSLLALLERIVGRGISHPEHTERPAKSRDEGTTAGPDPSQGASEGIEAIGVHAGDLRNRLRAAVEAKRQGGAQSPSSVGVLLGRSRRRSTCPTISARSGFGILRTM
ncbi:MAG TPA: hypothetical protein VE420_14755 [Gemmatimonadales bacterium]|nr:hypothetical protein [Gemmatimonadales bacterium]